MNNHINPSSTGVETGNSSHPASSSSSASASASVDTSTSSWDLIGVAADSNDNINININSHHHVPSHNAATLFATIDTANESRASGLSVGTQSSVEMSSWERVDPYESSSGVSSSSYVRRDLEILTLSQDSSKPAAMNPPAPNATTLATTTTITTTSSANNVSASRDITLEDTKPQGDTTATTTAHQDMGGLNHWDDFRPPYGILYNSNTTTTSPTTTSTNQEPTSQNILQEVLALGAMSFRPVIVSLQDYESDIGCHLVNRDIFGDATFEDLIRSKFLFVQFQRDSKEGRNYARRFKVRHCPHLGILHPNHGSFIWGIEGWESHNPWSIDHVLQQMLDIAFDRFPEEQLQMEIDFEQEYPWEHSKCHPSSSFN